VEENIAHHIFILNICGKKALSANKQNYCNEELPKGIGCTITMKRWNVKEEEKNQYYYLLITVANKENTYIQCFILRFMSMFRLYAD